MTITLHEIRTRFEVLRRDADITYLKGLIKGGSAERLRQDRLKRYQELATQFDLVARANIGDNPLEPATAQQLTEVAKQTWVRNFDRRLGLSQDELNRLEEAGGSLETLPVTEHLLADLPEHKVAWGDARPHVDPQDPNNIWGFDMEVPEYAYNHGEIYNLMTKNGTLTTEERFKVNDHVIQTIIMLSSLPLPRTLRNVPDIAGNHHERMDGQGYPRKLDASKLSVPERVLAIADVFEALTASDRPYKPAKTLSESLRILAYMARDQHIDPELFQLFVEKEIYLEYADTFLEPAQKDKIDARSILKLAGID